MPKWLIPWVVPGTLVVVAVLFGVVGSLHGGASALGSVGVFAIVAGALIYLRVQDLKKHPPNPELSHKPFWRR